MFVSANPQYKNLDLFNSRMEKQFQGIENKEKAGQSKPEDKKEKTEKENQRPDDDSDPKKEKKASKGKGMSV